MSKCKIKVLPNGPYLIDEAVPIKEKTIVEKPHINEWNEVGELPAKKNTALCRCGRSKNAPFCDGGHLKEDFNGQETAQIEPYLKRCATHKGSEVGLIDDGRCSLARFCHIDGRDVWDWIEQPGDDGNNTQRIIEGASACPTGRLTAIDKEGNLIEPLLEEEIIVIKEPLHNNRYIGIYVKGGIQLESATGTLYETRNRYTLCCCGQSRNKPFCDAAHESDSEDVQKEEADC